jgi:hypothetical protein
MIHTRGTWFEAQFKQYYERIFCHHFNYRTSQLENQPFKQQYRPPNMLQLRAVLNPLTFHCRRELRRRHHTGELYSSHIVAASHAALYDEEPTEQSPLMKQNKNLMSESMSHAHTSHYD